MKTLTVAVDNLEWDSLYRDPSRTDSSHKLHEGSVAEIQLWTNEKQVLYYWNRWKPKNDLAYLGLQQKDAPARNVTTVRTGTSLTFLSGYVRRIAGRPRKLDPRKQTINILLDCGLPVVIMEQTGRKAPSKYAQKEDEYLVALCHLWGSVAFSNSLFRAPIVGKILKITPLPVVPQSTLLEFELQPPQVVPETKVSYHAKDLQTIDPLIYSTVLANERLE